MRFVIAFGRFWYDFVVGDDWRVAAGAVAILVLAALGVALGLGGVWVSTFVLVGLVAVFSAPLLRGR
jgi:hypothetical protein